ncbi:hypothetical protein [Prosthecochloris sp.]|uniref:hypothetical protein n=1 Tax=Prosthecochloris sp. TaxID=290513 RepID=UPI002579DEF7|nr:hypothetical protein [Prosthecochloris sp.]
MIQRILQNPPAISTTSSTRPEAALSIAQPVETDQPGERFSAPQRQRALKSQPTSSPDRQITTKHEKNGRLSFTENIVAETPWHLSTFIPGDILSNAPCDLNTAEKSEQTTCCPACRNALNITEP